MIRRFARISQRSAVGKVRATAALTLPREVREGIARQVLGPAASNVPAVVAGRRTSGRHLNSHCAQVTVGIATDFRV